MSQLAPILLFRSTDVDLKHDRMEIREALPSPGTPAHGLHSLVAFWLFGVSLLIQLSQRDGAQQQFVGWASGEVSWFRRR